MKTKTSFLLLFQLVILNTAFADAEIFHRLRVAGYFSGDPAGLVEIKMVNGSPISATYNYPRNYTGVKAMDAFSTWKLKDLSFERVSNRITLSYSLPADVLGSKSYKVSFTGPDEGKAVIHLKSKDGTADCVDRPDLLTCVVDMNGALDNVGGIDFYDVIRHLNRKYRRAFNVNQKQGYIPHVCFGLETDQNGIQHLRLHVEEWKFGYQGETIELGIIFYDTNGKQIPDDDGLYRSNAGGTGIFTRYSVNDAIANSDDNYYIPLAQLNRFTRESLEKLRVSIFIDDSKGRRIVTTPIMKVRLP